MRRRTASGGRVPVRFAPPVPEAGLPALPELADACAGA
ncbi:hypothetical protein GA0115259_109962, partial [Streptomyces sp. MnatMP-M17]